jgi:hypothetical protein
MLDHLCDRDFPALEALQLADVSRITGRPGTRLLRLRYRPGVRAVLHVALGQTTDAREGAIWFYAGGKTQKLARQHPDAMLDPRTGALFQVFPNDHRLPHLARFLDRAGELAPHLIGGPALRAPEVTRYRPGLSATFRWTRDDGRVFFVKHAADTDVLAQALVIANLADAARGSAVGFTDVSGFAPELGLIAYSAAPGLPFGTQLTSDAVAQVLVALRSLWSLSVVPERVLDRTVHLRRAALAQRMIALADPQAGQRAADLVARLEAWTVRVHLRPIHADMKLEHAILSGRRTTLIDMDSLSLGDPNDDLAMLDARVTLAQMTGQATRAEAESARRQTVAAAGPDFLWFLACARLQCAKHFAQRLDPAAIPLMRQILGEC